MEFTEQNDATHVIDMDSVEEPTFELFVKGWYNCQVSKMSYELSSSSGQPMWKVALDVEDGDNAGKTIHTFLSFSPKAVPYTKKTINQVWPGLLEDPNFRTSQNQFDLRKVADEAYCVGTRVRIKLDHQTYEGEKRNTVKQWSQPVAQNSFMGS